MLELKNNLLVFEGPGIDLVSSPPIDEAAMVVERVPS